MRPYPTGRGRRYRGGAKLNDKENDMSDANGRLWSSAGIGVPSASDG